jgi:hypothetical protein
MYNSIQLMAIPGSSKRDIALPGIMCYRLRESSVKATTWGRPYENLAESG